MKINEVAYGRLRDALMTGHFRAGQKVSLRSLAAEMQLGLTPTRDAVRRLAAEKALEVSSTGVVRIPSLGQGDLDEIMLARIPLECAAAALAARRITKDGIEQLARIEADKLHAQQAKDIQRALDRNAEFHFTIYRAAQAPLLLSLINQLWLRMGSLLRVYAERRDARHMGDGKSLHAGLVRALKLRDEAAASEAMARDIEYVADWIRVHAVGAEGKDQVL